MVSPSITAHPKSPPLSYADRAKKAQNIKSPISHRSIVQSVPPPTPTDAIATPLSPSKADTPRPPSDSPVATPPPTPHTTETLDVTALDNTKRASADLASKALSIVAAHTAAPKTPVANVWSLRMEQMAAARSTPHRTPQSQLSASQSMSIPPKSTLPQVPPKTPSSKVPANSAPNTPHGPSAVTAANGVTPLLQRDPRKVSRAQAVLPPIDTESWPEVGKSVAPTTAESKESANGISIGSDSGTTAASPTTSRKSEKTKWVPIPPEELQAAADAVAKASRSPQHSRSRKSQPTRSGNVNNNHAEQGSGSGSGSAQGQSRIQSASQSRVHSRSESLQSSPRYPRGRRLPGDDPVTGISGYGGQGLPERNHIPRSRASSPPLRVQPHLQPPPQPILPVEPQRAPLYTNNNANDTSGMAYPIPVYSRGQVHPNEALPLQYTSSNPHQSISPHGQHHGPLPMHQHRSRTSYHHSPGGTPPLPSLVTNPFHNSQPLTGPYPTYSMYAPYDYNTQSSGPQSQPHRHWSSHPSQPGSGHHSPVYSMPAPPYGMAYGPTYVTKQRKQHQKHHGRDGKGALSTTATSITTGGVDDDLDGRERPLPPEQSLPVAEYRPAAAPVSSPPADGSADAKSVETRSGKKGYGSVVFGSIGVRGARACLSPAPPQSVVTGKPGGEVEEAEEKPFAQFTIGVAPGEVGPVVRSRSSTHSTSHSHSGKRSRTATVDDGLVEVKEDLVATAAKVIDLTDAAKDAKDAKWEFGTATSTTEEESVHSDEAYSPSQLEAVAVPATEEERGEEMQQVKVYDAEPLQPILSSIASFDSPPHTSFASTASSPRQLQMRLQELSVSGPPPVHADGGDSDTADAEAEAFRVKDYGFGFGSGSRGSLSPPDVGHGQGGEKGGAMLEQEQGKDRRYKDKRDMEVPVRPRRGNGFYGGPGLPERGGYGRRGRGMNGYGRGFNRRGGAAFQPAPHHRQPVPPSTVTPPAAHLQALVNSLGDMANGFYPARPNLATYMPTGYEAYVSSMAAAPPMAHPVPPVPVPISPISFPLDPTRWYLLGQLEYYLSPQNMAQDFFLRQRMDSRGWVPISLIASFNRVRRLTMDVQLVRDVLILSSVVQVKDDWVRMVSWEQFVLPDASPSSVEHVEREYGEREYGDPHQRSYHEEHGQQGDESSAPVGEGEGDADADAEIDDDEEEDVVFVMNREEGAVSWSPDKRT